MRGARVRVARADRAQRRGRARHAAAPGRPRRAAPARAPRRRRRSAGAPPAPARRRAAARSTSRRPRSPSPSACAGASVDGPENAHAAKITPMPNVSIFSASIGAGHDVPAEVLATALRERGATADRHRRPADRRAGRARVIGGASSPGLDGGQPPLRGRLHARHAAGPDAQRRLRGMEPSPASASRSTSPRTPADVVVSTYPIWTELFGRMRLDGTLKTPVGERHHRPRGAALLGAPGDRPAPHHAPGVRGRGAPDRRVRARASQPSTG